MTKDEAMRLAIDAYNKFDYSRFPTVKTLEAAMLALRTALAQPEPVAMKFQIYRPTPPRGRELDPINSGLLPWVYDQDPSSGNIASMWVTPVAPLPPQRKPDEQIGITYEEANPPQPYCKRCGKKLGTEVTDIHTCTPKEIQPVAWVDSLNGARPDCVTDFKYLSVAQRERKEHLQYIALYTAAPKKEWVGLTDEERIDCEIRAEHNWVLFADIIEAKLKEKNDAS